jgi:hypothetical protein
VDSCFSGPKTHCELVLVDFAFVYKNLYLQYPRNYRQNLILMMTRKISIDFGNVFTKVVQGGLFYSSTKADFNSLREKFWTWCAPGRSLGTTTVYDTQVQGLKQFFKMSFLEVKLAEKSEFRILNLDSEFGF